MLTEGKEFRSAIKEERIKLELTIKQVSDLTGVPYRSLQNWEMGVRKCPDYVEKMIVDNIRKSNHQTFLEILLEVLQVDLENATSEETKEYISNTINAITKHLNK